MTTESREDKYVRKKLLNNLTKRSIQDSAGENTEQIKQYHDQRLYGFTSKGICAPASLLPFKYGRVTINAFFSNFSAGIAISNVKVRMRVKRSTFILRIKDKRNIRI